MFETSKETSNWQEGRPKAFDSWCFQSRGFPEQWWLHRKTQIDALCATHVYASWLLLDWDSNSSCKVYVCAYSDDQVHMCACACMWKSEVESHIFLYCSPVYFNVIFDNWRILNHVFLSYTPLTLSPPRSTSPTELGDLYFFFPYWSRPVCTT